MFQSVKEKLTSVKNATKNNTYSLIADYLLNCIENKKKPSSKECSKSCFCSESVITAFSKKYGYDGFREITLRLKIENEYYNYNNGIKEIDPNFKSNYRNIINDDLDLIDDQKITIENLINNIKINNKIVALSSYQQIFNTELFVSELQLLGYNAHFNIQRKSNKALVDIINKEDIVIIVATGLDNQYVINYYNLIKEKNNNIFIICSPSQKHKFDESSKFIILNHSQKCGVLESSRSTIIMYLFSLIIYNL